MQRLWSLVFLVVPIACSAIYLLAALGVPPLQKFWLPPNYNAGGDSIDRLFVLTHLVAAVVLVLTMGALFWFSWQGSARAQATSTTAHHTMLEIVWTIVPACVLIALAVYQFPSWNENKLLRPQILDKGRAIAQPPLVKVVAKRFGWEFYHAGPDGLLETRDDVFVENLLVLPVGEDVVLQLESRDVLHSFFVPGLRVKQDVVPGLPQFLWFRVEKPVELEMVCAELCGWGHYTMQGRVRFVPRAEYEAGILVQRALPRSGHLAHINPPVTHVALRERRRWPQPTRGVSGNE